MKRKLSIYSLLSQIFILLLFAGSSFAGYERVSYPVAPGTNKVLTLPEGLSASYAPIILVKSDIEKISNGVMTISNAYISSDSGALNNRILGNITSGTSNNYNILPYYGDVSDNGVADLIYLTVIKAERDSIYFTSGNGLIDFFMPYNSISAELKSYSFEPEYRKPTSFAVMDINNDNYQDFVIWYEEKQLILIDEIINPIEPEDSIPGVIHLLSDSPETNNFYHGDFDWDGKEDFLIAGYLFHNLGNSQFKKYSLDIVAGNNLRFVGITDNYPFTGYKSHLIFARESVSFEGDEVVIAEFNSEIGIQEVASVKFEQLFNVTKAWIGHYSQSSALIDVAAYSSQQGKLDIQVGIIPFIEDQEYFTGSATYGFDNLSDCLPGGPVDIDQDSQTDWVFLDAANDSLITLQYNEPLYVDKTAEKQLAGFEPAGLAVAVGDYNRDGYEDVFIANAGGPDMLLQNRGGFFTDVAAEVGVANNNDGISAAWGDYDSDGNLDLVVTGFSLAIKLYHNTGNGTFEDKSSILPTRDPNQRITSVSWGDINRDGWLDMLLGNYDGPDMIYINSSSSNSGATDSERKFGLTKLYFDNRTYHSTECATLIDINNDMLLDIVSVAVDGPVNLLMSYHNQFFADSSDISGFNTSDRVGKIGQSMCWGDLDGDSYQDLYLISNQGNDILYTNTSFNFHTKKFGAQKYGSPGGTYGEMSGVIDDLTGDGIQNLMIARSSQFGDLIAKPKDVLFSYSGSSTSPLNSSSNGERLGLTGDELSCLPVSADFDRDGDIDLLFVNYRPDNSSNLFFGSKAPLRYLENQSQQSNVISIRLYPAAGKVSTGARAELTFRNRTYAKVISGGNGRIQNGQRLSFNIGRDVTSADSLVVYWPSGNISKISGPIYPSQIQVYEKRKKYTISPVKLPGTYPTKEDLYVGPDSFEVVVDLEDSFSKSASDSVLLTIKENLYSSDKIVKEMQPMDGKPNRFRSYIKNPGMGKSRFYFISVRQDNTLAGNYPENTTVYLELKISEQIRLGDVNLDGNIDIRDVISVAKILIDDSNFTDEQLFRADFNQDGEINIQDAVAISYYSPVK